jgi:hypothetical protein
MSQETLPGMPEPEPTEDPKEGINAQDVIKTWSEIYSERWKLKYTVLPKDAAAAKKIASYFRLQPWKLYRFLKEAMEYLSLDPYWHKNLCIAAIPPNVNGIRRAAMKKIQQKQWQKKEQLPTAGEILVKEMRQIAVAPDNGVASEEMAKIRNILKKG